MNTGFLDPRYADTHKNTGPIDMGPIDEDEKLLAEWIRANLPKFHRPTKEEE
jgi:hypothetical protein